MFKKGSRVILKRDVTYPDPSLDPNATTYPRGTHATVTLVGEQAGELLYYLKCDDGARLVVFDDDDVLVSGEPLVIR